MSKASQKSLPIDALVPEGVEATEEAVVQDVPAVDFAPEVPESPEEARMSSVNWSRHHKKQARADSKSAFVFGVDCPTLSATVPGFTDHRTAEGLFFFLNGIKNGKTPHNAFAEAFGSNP